MVLQRTLVLSLISEYHFSGYFTPGNRDINTAHDLLLLSGSLVNATPVVDEAVGVIFRWRRATKCFPV